MLRIEDCQPGVVVECIEDGDIYRNPACARWEGLLQRGAIYTVRWGGMHMHPVYQPYLGVRLVDVDRFDDMPFAAIRFRLLPDSRLAVFRAMLAPQPAEREAELLRAIEGAP